MSSPGVNPLAIIAPDLYAKQLAIQRRQALAQSLLEQGQANMGSSPYGGLRSAGNAILGAYLAKSADKDTAALYAPPPPSATAAVPLSQQDVPEPQISNVAGTGPSSAPASGGASPQALGAALQGSLPASTQTQAQRTIPSVMGDAIPALPGLSKQQSMLEYFQSPAEYWKALAPTPEYRNTLMAAGGDDALAHQMMLQTQNKAGAINTTRGMSQIPDGKGGYNTVYAPPPAPPGYTYQQGQDGQPQLVPVAGGQQAVAGSNLAAGVPKALLTPQTGFGPDNLPTASNALAMSGNAALAPQMGIGAPQGNGPPPPRQPGLNINANNPLNMQPGGQEKRYSTPTAGLGDAWDNLGRYGAKGINTVNKIVSTWAPKAPPDYAQNVARQLGVSGDQPLNMSDPNVKGALIDAMRPNETGTKYGPGVQASPALRPELPAGQQPYMASLGKDAGERHDAVVAAASESPLRINVLDNIIGLSKQGVATGPGQNWQNTILGYASNTPILSSIMGKAKDNVGRFQELQKFTYQNAIRSWQAAGGTGTDAQMESMAHANPNDQLFPQALQQIAQWGKAAELAVQAKANAQDKFLSQNGQNPQSQIAFENTWRNAFDPKVFQYSLLAPPERAQWLKDNGITTPAQAQSLIAKQQQLKALGAIQ